MRSYVCWLELRSLGEVKRAEPYKNGAAVISGRGSDKVSLVSGKICRVSGKVSRVSGKICRVSGKFSGGALS